MFCCTYTRLNEVAYAIFILFILLETIILLWHVDHEESGLPVSQGLVPHDPGHPLGIELEDLVAVVADRH